MTIRPADARAQTLRRAVKRAAEPPVTPMPRRRNTLWLILVLACAAAGCAFQRKGDVVVVRPHTNYVFGPTLFVDRLSRHPPAVITPDSPRWLYAPRPPVMAPVSAGLAPVLIEPVPVPVPVPRIEKRIEPTPTAASPRVPGDGEPWTALEPSEDSAESSEHRLPETAREPFPAGTDEALPAWRRRSDTAAAVRN